jgi:opacity protein-like surface antigen
MKKIITLSVLAIAMMVTVPANAQKLKFGLKGGLNVNKMKTDKEVGKSDNQAGFFIGPTIKLTTPLAGLSFDAAALFDQRTAKIKDVVEEKIKMNSIQIPINVRYGVGLGSAASIFAFVGPQFGFNVGSSKKEFEEVEWKTNASNLSVNFGLGATVLKHLQVTANYNLGLGKTGEFKEKSTINQAKTVCKGRNNTWQIGVAYFF